MKFLVFGIFCLGGSLPRHTNNGSVLAAIKLKGEAKLAPKQDDEIRCSVTVTP
ncbi:hypothetical protein ACQR09_14005 [Bradyrhizobium oligotrophicum]|uniref:hypothetical protein n=1 Tax=Bradyrhizobium oligotrophicum TaxID=44255 RepID=UPI003EBFC7D9